MKIDFNDIMYSLTTPRNALPLLVVILLCAVSFTVGCTVGHYV